jgi:predicted nucleotidyltransferase
MPGYLSQAEVLARVTLALRAALGPDLVRLSLFGSRARGEARPASDYDLMVVVERRRPAHKEAVYALAGDYLADHRVDLSPKVLAREEIERLLASGLPFWRRFAADEVVLWARPN